MGLLKLILIFGIIYYTAKIIGWVLMPLFSHRFSGNSKNDYADNLQNFTREAKRNEGKITIKNTNKRNKNYSKNEGEYTDYEEIN